MASTIKLKNGSGAPTTGDLVQGEPALDLTNKRLYTENASGVVIEVGTNPSTIDINSGTIDGTVIGGSTAAAITGTTITGTSFVSSGDMTFGDDDKAIFGAGSDLQIYHDGHDSYVSDTGGGSLYLRGSNQVRIESATGEKYFIANADADTNLYYDNAAKLATTATGIDVTGTATADGLTVDKSGGNIAASFINSDSNNSYIQFQNSTTGTTTYTDGSLVGIDSDESLTIWQLESNHIKFGTSATERMRIDSSGNVGIGTSSPTGAKLQVVAESGSNVLGVGTTTQGLFIKTTGTTVDYNSSGNSGGEHTFSTGNIERMRIEVSGNLGLGVVPSAWRSGAKAFQSGGNGLVTLWEQANGSTNLGFGVYESASNVFNYTTTGDTPTLYSQLTGVHKWFTAPSGTAGNAISFTQAMTLDASGNLLVGKTASAFGTAGIEARAGGTLWATASGTNAASFNRLTNDGDIAIFNKDGAPVGSIGVRYSNLYAGRGTSGLAFSATGLDVHPFNPSTLDDSDAAIDLGVSSSRFKDLYLSGGVYLGGTGAANHLDDYEEGTWTPVTNSGSWTVNAASYTKVGNMVTCRFRVTATATIAVNDFTGLPFTPAADSGGVCAYQNSEAGASGTDQKV
jgi:uncharacterized protein YaiE (UPF0345 family)